MHRQAPAALFFALDGPCLVFPPLGSPLAITLVAVRSDSRRRRAGMYLDVAVTGSAMGWGNPRSSRMVANPSVAGTLKSGAIGTIVEHVNLIDRAYRVFGSPLARSLLR